MRSIASRRGRWTSTQNRSEVLCIDKEGCINSKLFYITGGSFFVIAIILVILLRNVEKSNSDFISNELNTISSSLQFANIQDGTRMVVVTNTSLQSCENIPQTRHRYAIYFSGSSPRLPNGDQRAFGYGFLEFSNTSLSRKDSSDSDAGEIFCDQYLEICWSFSLIGMPGLISVSLDGPLYGIGETSIFSKDCFNLILDNDLPDETTGRYSSCVSSRSAIGKINIDTNDLQDVGYDRNTGESSGHGPHSRGSGQNSKSCITRPSFGQMESILMDIFLDPSRYYLIARSQTRPSGTAIGLFGGEWLI